MGTGDGPDGRFMEAEGLFIQREDQPAGSDPSVNISRSRTS